MDRLGAGGSQTIQEGKLCHSELTRAPDRFRPKPVVRISYSERLLLTKAAYRSLDLDGQECALIRDIRAGRLQSQPNQS